MFSLEYDIKLYQHMFKQTKHKTRYKPISLGIRLTSKVTEMIVA